MFNEIDRDRDVKKKIYYFLQRDSDKYMLSKQNDSPFGYHLLIKNEIKDAISKNYIKKYHFALFRNLLEKTATYLGYNKWGDLITISGISEDERQGYIRKINFYSHNKHSELDSKELEQHEKNMLKLLFENFIKEFKWKE